MKLISKFNKGIRFYCFFIDVYSKYAWIVPLKHKKDITISNTLQKVLNESYRKQKR